MAIGQAPRTTPTAGDVSGRAQPLGITESAPRRRRRPYLVAAGLALSMVGSLCAVWAYDQAGDRVSVIAVARAVPAGQTIQPADLAVARIAKDPALHPVPVSKQSDIVGKTAAADLPAGSLVTEQSVRHGPSPTRGQDIVGVLAKPGQMPAEGLNPGDPVDLVLAPAADPGASAKTGTGQAPQRIEAVVVRVADAAAAGDGSRIVDVAVPPQSSTMVASWAAAGNVVVVLKGRA